MTKVKTLDPTGPESNTKQPVKMNEFDPKGMKIEEEMVAYHKTFWLRIIQRKWKKIYKQRREIIKKRKLMKSLNIRSLYGKWPKGLCNIPKLCGMLNNL